MLSRLAEAIPSSYTPQPTLRSGSKSRAIQAHWNFASLEYAVPILRLLIVRIPGIKASSFILTFLHYIRLRWQLFTAEAQVTFIIDR